MKQLRVSKKRATTWQTQSGCECLKDTKAKESKKKVAKISKQQTNCSGVRGKNKQCSNQRQQSVDVKRGIEIGGCVYEAEGCTWQMGKVG